MVFKGGKKKKSYDHSVTSAVKIPLGKLPSKLFSDTNRLIFTYGLNYVQLIHFAYLFSDIASLLRTTLAFRALSFDS